MAKPAGASHPAPRAMEPPLPALALQTTLPAALTGEQAFAALAAALTSDFHAHILAVMDSDEVAAVHKARVTLRRFRAALAAFALILDDDLAEAMADRARSLFRILGTARDADVMAERLGGTDRAAELAKAAQAARAKTRKLLTKKKAAQFQDWVAKRLKGKAWQQSGKKAKTLRDGPVQVLAGRALQSAWDAAVSNGPHLALMRPRALHELRKDLKMLRYLSEFFVDLWLASTHDCLLTTLRHLQDDLGEVTDHEMALALGHPAEPDVADGLAKAADDLAALVAAGPWWGDAVA